MCDIWCDMRITIVRHGETEEAQRGVACGHIGGNLSEEGVMQAKKVAERLKDEKFDVIISSDLKRALDTATEIAKHHGENILTSKNLREIDLGKYNGKKKKDLGIPEDKLISDFILPGEGETTEDFFGRAKKFVDFLKNNYKGKNILLVGHNGINKAIIGNMLGYNYTNFNEIERLKNTSVCVIDMVDEKFKVKLMNCTRHLNGNN
jgi:alpha-ribazole phosphatase